MFVLYGRGFGPSGRLLAQYLGAESGRTLTGQHDVIVRFGSPATVNEGGAFIVNSADSIGRCANKLLALRLIRDNGVSVPPYSTNFGALDLPILGRRSNHTGGRDVKLYMQRADLEVLGPSDYYVQFIPKKREFRVHVVGRRAVKLSRKVYQGNGNLSDAVCWNYSNGFRFLGRDDRTPPIGHFAAIAIPAVTSLGLDFGAVDLFESEDGAWYVTEVNSAPGLEHYSATCYANNIRRLLERRF